jgi:starch synthase
MACGLPVVTTPVGDNARLVDAPRRGLLVPVDDVPALAAALEQSFASAWDRAAIARYGKDYTWDEAARQTARFFRKRLGLAERAAALQSPPLSAIESATFNGGVS